MKRYLFTSAFLLLILILKSAAQVTIGDLNCSTIIVGKDASATGFVMVAHNEDDGGNQIVNFYKTISHDNKKGEIVRFKDGAVEQQASHSYAFFWIEMPGQDFADTYLNENGVIITSNSCPSRERFGEIVDGGIGYELRRLVAERSLSARVGVELAGQMVEKWGYAGSGRTYSIADKNEAWIFAVVRGKQWVAQRIPDNMVAFIPNYYTIKEIDLTDGENFLASKDLIPYAERRGWYNKETDGAFNFAKVYSDPRELASMNNIARMWTGARLLSGTDYELTDQFPVCFVPQKKVGLKELMEVLGNHFEGTPLDDSGNYKKGSPHNNKTHNICASHQQFSMIAELRSGMTFDIGGRMWIAPRRGCVNPYMPFYFGITEIPANLTMDTPEKAYELHFKRTEAIYDRTKPMAWWNFVAVAEHADQDFEKREPQRRKIKEELQQAYIKLAAQLEKDYLPIYKKQPAKASELLNNFEKDVLARAIAANNKYLER
jgi:dipeptidase